MYTNGSQPASVLNRLERMDRENRWWKIVSAGATACLALVVLMGAVSPNVADEVRARRFTLVDEQGRERAHLQVGPSTMGAILDFVDTKGRPAIHLGLGVTDWPNLRFSNEQFGTTILTPTTLALGSNRILLSASHDGSMLSMGEMGDTSVFFSTKPDVSLVLLKKGGQQVWRIP